METRVAVEISRVPEAVFDFTTQHVAEWSEIVVSDEIITEVPGGVGTTFRTTVEDRGRRMQFDGEITKHTPPTAHSVSLKGMQFDMQVDYTFDDLSGRTRVIQVSVVQPKGVLKLFFFLFGWMMKRSGCDAAQKQLDNLKRLLEESAEDV